MGITYSNEKININNEKIDMDNEKAMKIIKYAQDKIELAKIAINNEETAKILAEKLKKEAEDAQLIATQVGNTLTVSQDVRFKLVDNALELAERSNHANYEVAKASEERIKAERTVELANQRIMIAQNINKIANKVGIIPNTFENFKNTKVSNSTIILIILILIIILAYRNKEFVRKTFNVNL